MRGKNCAEIEKKNSMKNTEFSAYITCNKMWENSRRWLWAVSSA